MSRPALTSLSINEPTKDQLRFVEYLGVKNGRDVHLLKVLTEDNQGNKFKEVQILENIQKPFWTTKKIKRVHRDKREYEPVSQLDIGSASESKIAPAVAKALGMKKPSHLCQMKDVVDSPYVYGLNISASNYIKDWYMRNGKDSPWDYATLDTEVCIDDPYNEYMTHISISRKESSSMRVIRERFEKHNYKNDEEIIAHIKKEYIENVPNGQVMWDEKPRNIYICDDIETMIRETFAELHRWSPDILGIWNMDYDISKIEIEWRDRLGKDMAELFHDPSVPYEYKHYDYYRGSNVVKTILDDGSIKTKTKKYNEVWHDLRTSAGFKVIDTMGTFYQLRSQEPDIEGGFSLDNVLSKILNLGKIKDDSKLVKRAWHISTSKNKPAFYTCYGMFDTDSMLLLEDKLGDMRTSAPGQLGASEWGTFSGLPRRLHVAIHFFIRDLGYVVGTKPAKVVRDAILGIGGGWIVTVPAYKKLLNGLRALYENPRTPTSHYRMVYDMDEVSAYPFATVAANVSRITTLTELISIEGYGKSDFLKANINIIINACNSYIYCVQMLGVPGFKALYDELDEMGKIKK